jgi:hypothetical protein
MHFSGVVGGLDRCDDDDGDETVEKEVSGERSGSQDAKESTLAGPR